jgi:hypothetical protein
MTIQLYDTHTLQGVIRTIKPANQVWLSLAFPRVQTFDTEFIDFDVLAQPEMETARDPIVKRMMRGGKGKAFAKGGGISAEALQAAQAYADAQNSFVLIVAILAPPFLVAMQIMKIIKTDETRAILRRVVIVSASLAVVLAALLPERPLPDADDRDQREQARFADAVAAHKANAFPIETEV